MEQQPHPNNQAYSKFNSPLYLADLHIYPSIKILPVQDINKKIIQLKYSDIQKSLTQLVKDYRQTTQCKKEIQGRPIQFELKSNGKKIKPSLCLIKEWIQQFYRKNIKIALVKEQDEAILYEMSVKTPFNIQNYHPEKTGKTIKLQIIDNFVTQKILTFVLDQNDKIGYLKYLISLQINRKARQFDIFNVRKRKQSQQIKNLQIKNKQQKKKNFQEQFQDIDSFLQVDQQKELYQIRIIKNQNYISDFKIQVLINRSNKNHQNENIEVGQTVGINDIEPSTKVQEIFNSLKQQLNFNSNQYSLSFQGEILDLNKTLSQLKIKNKSLLVLVHHHNPLKEQLMEEGIIIRLNIQDNKYVKLIYYNVRDMTVNEILCKDAQNYEKYVKLIYQNVRDMTVNEILCKYVQNYEKKEDHQKFWGLSYKNKIINSQQKFFTLIEKLTEKQIIVNTIRNHRYFFNKNLNKKLQVQDYNYKVQELQQNIIEKQRIQNQIKQRCLQQNISQNKKNIFLDINFYKPIYVYTLNKNYQKINKYLRKLKINKFDDYKQDEQYLFTRTLIKSLQKLPNCTQNVYRCIDFKYTSKNQKVKTNQLICFSSFTSTSKCRNKVGHFTNDSTKYTLFIIKSITGKDISSFSHILQQQQVLFLPFTYFYIVNIQKYQNHDVIYLIEMPTPLRFENVKGQQKIIVWVDDEPQSQDNRRIIQNYQSYPNFQIIQILSTRIACLWMNDYYNLLKILGIKLIVVSDMVREEHNQNNELQIQHFAGVQLIKKFNNHFHYNDPILIFCKDVQIAQQNLYNVKEKYYKLSKQLQYFLEFLSNKKIKQ